MEVVILVKCTTFKQYNQRHTHESTKREENNFELQHKNMCHIWHSLKDATAQNKNAHIWAGLTFHIYFFLECKLCISSFERKRQKAFIYRLSGVFSV